jgi:proline dehydrogenase
MQELLNSAALSLKKAALNPEAKSYILNNKPLFNTLKKAANRYIGGENLQETVYKVIEQNTNGFKCSVEFMGENTSTAHEANHATAEFLEICKAIDKFRLNATISLDLSHIGLIVSKELCMQNLNAICSEALKYNIEVIISSEGPTQTDSVLQIYSDASAIFSNLSITLQAYLYRTKEDFKEMIQHKGRIRMVKGAFETDKAVSIPRGHVLDDVYLDYIDQLLIVNHQCSIATHHHYIQQEVKKLLVHYHTPQNVYEFESLYGIQNHQLAILKQEGYSTKVYFVYGKEWYLYLCNRIAEYPLNLFTAVNDIVS